MSTFERLFASCILDLVVPDTSLEYPPQTSTDDWLARLQAEPVSRKQAFFDEQLQSLLTVRIDYPPGDSSADPACPPPELLAFITHIQISLEASYISPIPAESPETLIVPYNSAPPRTTSFKRKHPSIVPPSTPNPTPSTVDHDKRYVASEGTLLLASIWGQGDSEGSGEAFSLLWSDKEEVWVAVYRLAVTVSFLRLTISDPLLCLTVSATLREKRIQMTHPNHPLSALLATAGDLTSQTAPPSPTSANSNASGGFEDRLNGLPEINLLEGLTAGTTLPSATDVYLPSTRLGAVSRQKLFSLPPIPPITPAMPSPSPMAAVRAAHPTLRKSFRRTLETASGFRVRMRTVFIPYVLLPEAQSSTNDDDTEDDERERREAGNEERTVVLCVELENSGESGPEVGFKVEGVDVSVGGEGAHATFIGWGDESCFGDSAKAKSFPLLIGSMEQYNLLYAVSFQHSPDEVDAFSLRNDGGENLTSTFGSDLQRAVAINIRGKPYLNALATDSSEYSYPTQTFASRWNCVLDLSTSQNQHIDTPESPSASTSRIPNTLPEPASPFPLSPRTAGGLTVSSSSFGMSTSSLDSSTPVLAGSKRYTLPGSSGFPKRSALPSAGHRASTPTLMLHSGTSSKLTYTPPSQSALVPRTPTTYAAPPPPPDSADLVPPMTPAYPAYAPHTGLPPTPQSQAPVSSHQAGTVGPSVEIRREHGAGGVPPTPGPFVGGGGGFELGTGGVGAAPTGETIVVSVGLLPMRRGKAKYGPLLGPGTPGMIFPLDTFTLDIFVYNQSERTRRLEVSCPERRRRRAQEGRGVEYESGVKSGGEEGGILPLTNRVRIGPLRPSTCQSVRMEFLALTPGVHAVDTLTLVDVESGFSMNLRSVMDVVVHEPS